jgi:hypothetical protein
MGASSFLLEDVPYFDGALFVTRRKQITGQQMMLRGRFRCCGAAAERDSSEQGSDNRQTDQQLERVCLSMLRLPFVRFAPFCGES